LIPPSESEHGHFNVDVPEDQVILHPRGGHNYYGGRDMERLQRRLKAITLDLESSGPLPKATPSAARSISGETVRHSLSNSTLLRRVAARVTRRASWTANEDEKPSPSSGDGDGSSGSSGSSPEDVRITSMTLTSEPEQEWVCRYLEREKKEEETWQQRLQAQAKPSTLGRLASLKVFSGR
jgi:hypothetical protein